jgi:phage shock protein PspC (stress-responsive transcriptional regulator)
MPKILIFFCFFTIVIKIWIFLPLIMTRSATDKWLGGVLGGIARSLGISSGLLRGLFLVFFFGVGGLTFGISSGATLVIYLIFWFTLGKS